MNSEIQGTLEIDHERGVLYFHDHSTGITRLRICQLGPIPKDFSTIDVTNKIGAAVYQNQNHPKGWWKEVK
jgi:hypothetical protein